MAHREDRKSKKTRVLFVDDEPTIRLTLPAILELHDFEVKVTASVPEALAAIQAEKFDVLLADLNIGQPGDGFTVVSAMRRTQADALTIIITGFPAFETALEAIRNQVDDYIVKPTETQSLVALIRDKLRQRRPQRPMPVKRVATIVRENRDSILRGWLAAVERDARLSRVHLDDTQRINHLPLLLDELAQMLETRPNTVSERLLETAAQHGITRRKQGYTVPMMVNEARLLRCTIYSAIQQNLLATDISHLIADMVYIGNSLDEQVERSIEAYLGADIEPQAA